MRRTRLFLAACAVVLATTGQAQVTYMRTNNYFLNRFTDIGFESYDWRYEPLKTDLERGRLKGNVVRVVTTIKDKSGNQYGDSFSDTTLYNAQGNILRVSAPKVDAYNPKQKFRPDTWEFEYDAKGRLKQYTWWTESAGMYGTNLQKHIHTMEQDARGNFTREIYRAYSLENGQWREFGGVDLGNVVWSCGYDANGTLTSGTLRTDDGKATYQNGQLVSLKMKDLDKPMTYTYDANGQMTGMKVYVYDAYDDDEWYTEKILTFSYNQQGDIAKVERVEWDDTKTWVHKKRNEQTTYTFTYTYDAKGNWTKAVVAMRTNIGGKISNLPAAITVTRAISYGHADKPTAATPPDPSSSMEPTETTIRPTEAMNSTFIAAETSDENKVYEVVEEMPQFPGGKDEMNSFFSRNMKYPPMAEENGIAGTVKVQFVVEKDGNISDVKVVRSPDPSLEKEALRLVKLMPKWTPGRQGGKPIRVRYTVPVRFQLR